MATYEDGLRECKALLLNEADGLDHAALLEGGSNAGKIFAAQADYFRLLVAQLEQREAFHRTVSDLADEPRDSVDYQSGRECLCGNFDGRHQFVPGACPGPEG